MRRSFLATFLALFACADDGSGDELPPGAFTTGGDDGIGDDDGADLVDDGASSTTPATSTPPTEDTGPPPELSFAEHVLPIVSTTCLGPSCHEPPAPGGTLILSGADATDPYTELTSREHVFSGMPYVTPGDPAQSYVYRKLEGTHLDGDLAGLGTGGQMPLALEPLPEGELGIVRDWILSGAMP